MSLRKLIAKLVDKRQLSDEFWWFGLKFEKDFVFKAGQYVSVKVNKKGDRRVYSVASAPGGNEIGLLIDVSPNGIGSKFFLDSEIGDEVEVLGPLGRFVLKEGSSRLLFIATGSGVAPLKSMIDDVLKNRQYDGEIKLLWGLRNKKDVFWREEFKELERKYKNFEYKLALSKPDKDWKGDKGRVTNLLDGMEELDGYGIYVCGGREMVESCVKKVIDKGVEKENVYFEKYG